jgi:MFS transporter, AAHS family, 4-hydroxybenzoate transporter
MTKESTMKTTLPEMTVSDVVDNQPLSRFQISTTLMCGFVAVLDGFDTQCIGFLAPSIAESMDVPLKAFAPVFVAGLLGLMCGAGVLGPVADRWGRKWTIVTSTLGFGLFTFLTAFVTSFEELLLLRFLTGVGLGGAMPNVVALSAEYSPKRLQAIFVSMLFTGMPLGTVMGGLVASALLPRYGWQSLFYVGGLLPLAMALILIVKLPESVRFLIVRGANRERINSMMARVAPGFDGIGNIRFVPGTAATKGLSVKHLFTEGRTLGTILLWVPYFMNLLIIYFVISWFPAVLHQANMPTSAGVTAITLFSLGGIIGSLLQGVTMEKVGARRTLTTEFLLAVVLIGSLAMVPPSFGVVAGVALVLGIAVQGAQAGLNALVAEFYPTAIRSTGVGWALGIGRIGSIVGPILGGVMLSLEWSLQYIFLAGTVPALCAVLAVIAGAKHRSPSSVVISPAGYQQSFSH